MSCVFEDTLSELHRNILAIILATSSCFCVGVVVQPKPFNNPATHMRDPVDGAGSSRQPDHPLLGMYTLTICESVNTIQQKVKKFNKQKALQNCYHSEVELYASAFLEGRNQNCRLFCLILFHRDGTARLFELHCDQF